MLILESIKLALSTIWTNKIRSALTMLGIVIGISAVVMLMAMGEGIKKDIQKTVQGLGTNIVFVLGGNLKIDNSAGMHGGISNPANLISGDILKREDVEEIKKIPEIETAVAVSLVPGSVKRNDILAMATVIGADTDIKDIFTAMDLEKGRYLIDEDSDKNVIVIGNSVKKTLFGDNDPINQKINIGKEEMEVIGYLSKPASTGSLGSNELETISVIPFEIAKKFNKNEEKIHRIGIKIRNDFDIKEVAKKIEENMLKRHSKDDFSVFTQKDILDSLGTILNMLTMFISAIAAISLMVGGIGIMNIMLVSVTERTREIGLRKAVGATNAAILLQFLIEAIIISLLSAGISLFVVSIGNQIIHAKMSIEPQITPLAWILAIGVSILIGIVFGLAPAIRASRKDPIEALRYE